MRRRGGASSFATTSALVLLAFLVAAASAAALEGPTYYAGERPAVASVKRVVPPEYPRDALRSGLAGSVVVKGVLFPDGSMDARSYEPDAPGSEVFVDPLREVLPYWLFQVPLGNDCMPTAQPVSIRVDFEARDGEPHVFVTHTPTRAEPPPQEALKPLHEEKLEYPYRMIRLGLRQVAVFTRSDVDAEGKVVHVTAEVYARRERVKDALQPFATEAEEKLSRFTYPPAPGVRVRHLCYTIEYNLRD
ncbi:MAG TPA: hypothetical protein VFE23_04180 [Usitatibacter sp.]|nr:hypothetical protein [Usitatibacter sp.]